MLKINTLTVKNFMSIGNQTQALNFDRDDLLPVASVDVFAQTAPYKTLIFVRDCVYLN